MERALQMGLLAALTLTACGPKLIPGTEVRNTDENREILAVIEEYRVGIEERNPEKILSLVSPTFFEDAGTPEAGDDYDFAGLKARLETWGNKVQSARADFTVKRIAVKDGTAVAQYFYEVNYQVRSPSGPPAWSREADTNQLTLREEDGRWRIVNGL